MIAVFEFAADVASVVTLIWTWTWCAWCWGTGMGPGRLKSFLIELKYPFIVSEVIVQIADTMTRNHGWTYFIFMVVRAAWVIAAWRLKDDDRWKRRQERLASKVKQVGGKLIVVPLPDPVPIAARTR